MNTEKKGERDPWKISAACVYVAMYCSDVYERVLSCSMTAFAIYIQLCLPLIDKQSRNTIRKLRCPLSYTDAMYLPTYKYMGGGGGACGHALYFHTMFQNTC